MRLKCWVSPLLVLMCAARVQAADPPAKDLLAEALAKTEKMTDVMRDDVLLEVIYGQIQTGDLELAKTTLEKIDSAQLQGFAWGQIAAKLAQDGDIAGADALLAKLKDPQSVASVHSSVAVAQAKKGDIKAALATCDLIKDDYAKGSALEGVAKAQAIAGDLKSAEETVAMIKPAFIKAGAATDIAIALVKKKEGPEVVKHWIELGRAAAKADTMPAMGMGYVARAEVYAGDVASANAIVNEYAGSSAATMITGEILDAHLAVGNIKEARALGAKMTKPEEQLDFAVSLGTVMLKAGDKAGAAQALKDAQGLLAKVPGQKIFSVRQIASFMSDLNGPSEALKWVEGQSDDQSKVFGLLGVVSTLPEAKEKVK